MPTERVDGLEIWEGELRAGNAGPAQGDHFLGRVEGPGLYFIVDQNTGGKSTILRLIGKLQKEKLLRTEFPVTDGEAAGFLELAAARLTARRGPGGDVIEVRRQGTESLPRIEELPSPIDLMITGGHLKGLDARQRLRLERLLLYAPVTSTDELLYQLGRVLDERAFTMEPEREQRDLWNILTERAKEGKTRFKPVPFQTKTQIIDALAAYSREGILDDHGRLVTALNELGNSGEKAVEQQKIVVAQVAGRMSQVVEQTAGALGVQPGPAFLSKLIGGATGETARQALRAAQDLASDMRRDRKARVEEEARRGRLALAHGERPDISPQEARARQAEVRVTGAEAALRAAQDQAAAGSTADLDARVEDARRRVERAYESWGAATGAVAQEMLDFAAGVWPHDEVLSSLNIEEQAVAALRTALTDSIEPRQRLREAGEAKSVAAAAVTAAETALRQAREDKVEADADREAARMLRDGWEETARLIKEPVPGPEQAEVDAAEAAVREQEAAVRLAEGADAYRQVAAEHEQEERRLTWLTDVTEDYRIAAHESWTHLGQIVTEELALPWLMVSGMRILLVYTSNGRDARLARTKEEGRDVRDLDDAERISSAELHEAMLRLMLERREKLGGILIIPWQIMAALDHRRRRRFSGEAARRNLTVFSERPLHEGEEEGLRLERVEPLTETEEEVSHA